MVHKNIIKIVLPAASAKKGDDSAAEDTEMLYKTDKKNVVEELTTKFQQSPYAQR